MIACPKCYVEIEPSDDETETECPSCGANIETPKFDAAQRKDRP